jgi:MtN3 and saliva related transmembrane protein
MTSGTTAIGFVAAMLTTVAFLPQVVKVWTTQSAKDVSLGMYLILTIGVALWLVYGIFIVSWPMIISNAITLVLASAVLGMKLKFG